MAIFFAIGLTMLGSVSFGVAAREDGGVWGGPIAEPEVPLSSEEMNGLVLGHPMVIGREEAKLASFTDTSGPDVVFQGALRSQGTSFAAAQSVKLLIYKVRRGDTLSTIASRNGVSVAGLLSLNPNLKSQIKTGMEITIPAPNSILNVGPVVLASKSSGTAAPSSVSEAAPDLPDLKGYFVKPTTGFNWGKLHKHNGVDIANACGTEIFSAAEGIVTGAFDEGWNGGYGLNVLVDHPNGTKTRYAHLSKVNVSVGDYVEKGALIGLMGDTGEATGCHLHFEVEGARNFMAK